MPVSRKRKKDDRKRRNRESSPPPPGAPPEPERVGGLLSKMRGGIKDLTGTGTRKPESLLSKILTWALVLAVAYFAAKRLGLIP